MTGKPYTVYAVEGHPHGRWKRAVLWTSVALVVLLLAGAGGSYLWFRSQVVEANQRVDPEVVSALSSKPQSTLSTTPVTTAAAEEEPEPEPDSPSAMNILVLGSDHRQDEGETYGRSDTIILVHIDPDNDYLSLMSLPRDLRVEVPGYGMEKINAAFAFGGPALTILTVEQLTGVDINHYLEVDFEAFKDITDALGGVYVDVDRRYYNDDPSRELIKLAPGYQLLNGADSLDYVRFRHDLNGDFGRMDRQQRFLAAMREQAMGWQLPLKLPGLIGALFDNVSTDLDANDILKLAYWGIRLDGERIRQITLVAATDEIDGLSYVVATQRQLSEAVTAFVTTPAVGQGTSTPTTKTAAGTSSSTASTAPSAEAPDLGGVDVDVLNGSGRTGEAAAAKAWLAELGAEVVTVGNAGSTGQETTIVRYPEGHSDEAALVAEAVGSDAVELSESVERVTVVLGLDFELPTGLRACSDGRHHSRQQRVEGPGDHDPLRASGACVHPRGLQLQRPDAADGRHLRHRGGRRHGAGSEDDLPAEGERRQDRPVHGHHRDDLDWTLRRPARARRSSGTGSPSPSWAATRRSTTSGGRRTGSSTGSRTPSRICSPRRRCSR